jgi:hypothetical protein
VAEQQLEFELPPKQLLFLFHELQKSDVFKVYSSSDPKPGVWFRKWKRKQLAPAFSTITIS